MKRPVLVLGASGRVGKLLRGIWGQVSDTPVIFHARTPAPGIDIAAPFAPDLTAFLSEPPAAVVVLPGVVPGAEQDLNHNTTLALTGLEIAAACQSPVAILCSSAAVYGGRQVEPFTEDDACGQVGQYGAAKRAMEQAAADWRQARSAGPLVLCLRLANIIGADMLADAVRRANAGTPLWLDRFASGKGPRRSYLSPATFVRAIEAIAQQPPEGTFSTLNLSEVSDAIEMSDLLDALEACGHGVTWSWRDAAPTALQSHAMDSARFRAQWPEAFLTKPLGARDLVADWLAAEGATT